MKLMLHSNLYSLYIFTMYHVYSVPVFIEWKVVHFYHYNWSNLGQFLDQIWSILKGQCIMCTVYEL